MAAVAFCGFAQEVIQHYNSSKWGQKTTVTFLYQAAESAAFELLMAGGREAVGALRDQALPGPLTPRPPPPYITLLSPSISSIPLKLAESNQSPVSSIFIIEQRQQQISVDLSGGKQPSLHQNSAKKKKSQLERHEDGSGEPFEAEVVQQRAGGSS
ncbi:hypothetical protein EJ110_NYTH39631 [Nymphaea thermarum]|nr:hypothetical protein EJ110_NYTH39631 [Nymphaea thermarum]